MTVLIVVKPAYGYGLAWMSTATTPGEPLSFPETVDVRPNTTGFGLAAIDMPALPPPGGFGGFAASAETGMATAAAASAAIAIRWQGVMRVMGPMYPVQSTMAPPNARPKLRR